MPNPSGKNGYGNKNYPPNDILRESLMKYAKQGLQQKEKLARLELDHNLVIGTTKLNKLEKQLDIPSVRRSGIARESTTQAVLDEMDKDIGRRNGPNYVKQKLRLKGVMLPRDKVRKIMLENDPEGFNHRYPGHQKNKTSRTTLTSIGPFREISADGHEKLGKLALKMGDVGLSIYAYKDKWTANLLKITVIPDCRSVGAIGHLYLDFCEEYGGVPTQLNLDKGAEIGWQFSIQEALRELFAPEIDSEVIPPCVLLKSVHNIIIEALWKWLKEKEGMNMKEHILRGKNENIFNSNIDHHRDLFNWIFPPLVQAELDEFKTWWNNHKIRPQKDKAMLSGHLPDDALSHPNLHGGMECLVSVSKEALENLRESLTQEEGSRDSHLRWVSEEFEAIAMTLYENIGGPKITWANSWKVFVSLCEAYEDL